MTIQAGDRLPEAPLQRIRDGVETVDTGALFEGKKIVLFAVPGAFTPTCSEKHLPGFVQHFDEFRNKGIFYENVTNQILDDLVAACRPRRMTVVGDFSVRGGIKTEVTVRYEQPSAKT